MTTRENHYQFLGLPYEATGDEIEAALARFDDPAYALAHTDPGRVDGLHELLQRIRGDLLSTPERRKEYDRSLRKATVLVAEGLDVREVTAPIAPTAGRVRVASLRSRQSRRREMLAGIALALIMLAVVLITTQAFGIFSQQPGSSLALSSAGLRDGAGFASGTTVRLHWTPVRGALRYRLQIGVSPLALSQASRKNIITVTTRSTSFNLPVLGAQMYSWRVRALGKSGAGRFTSWRAFAVEPPIVGRPRHLRSNVLSAHGPSKVRLCWSAVRGATSYRLTVPHVAARSTTGTCAIVRAGPGHHAWSVAARIRAAQTYTGLAPGPAHFIVHMRRRIERHAHRKAHHKPARAARASNPAAKAQVPRAQPVTYYVSTPVPVIPTSTPVAVAPVASRPTVPSRNTQPAVRPQPTVVATRKVSVSVPAPPPPPAAPPPPPPAPPAPATAVPTAAQLPAVVTSIDFGTATPMSLPTPPAAP